MSRMGIEIEGIIFLNFPMRWELTLFLANQSNGALDTDTEL